MTSAMGRLPTAHEDKGVDYSPLLGFIQPTVRIDPHTHDAEQAHQIDLRQLVEIVRDRRAKSDQNG
jgi:hypothetical protein